MGFLDKKTAFITGGAMGNGRGIAEAMNKAGANVVMADVSKEVYKTAAEIGENVLAVEADITKIEDVNRAVKMAIDRFGTIDILVNNAGVARFSRFIDADVSLLDYHLNINVRGAWNCTRAILPLILKSGWGRIINMSSVTGVYVVDPGEAAYATSKAALIGFTKALAVETADKNITVNALCPGYILTSMVRKSAADSNPENPQSVIDGIAQGIPMKHLGTPEDIGNLAVFLASDAASYITGQAITIDGGNGLPETNSMGLK